MKPGFFSRLLLLMLALSIPDVCTSSARLQETSKDSNLLKSRKVKLGVFGYLVLPKGYRAYQTADLRDAWYGYIAYPGQTFRIRYTAGLVQTPFQNGEDKFVWLKQETIRKQLLKYGLLRTAHGEEIAATIGTVNFYAPVKTESEMNLFLDIVRSYRFEHCEDCEPVFQTTPANKRLQ